MKIQDVLLMIDNVKRSTRGWTGRCPSHQDEHNSLSVAEGYDGQILLHCHAGCAFDDIINTLREKSDTPSRTRSEKTGYRPDREATTVYPYFDELGMLLYQVVRFENPKEFRPRVPDGRGGFNRGLPQSVRRVLYRLPELLKSDPLTMIFIVEGEKDVETLRERGLVSTCNVGGAGKWREEYNEALRDRHVCILPDHDRPGIEHSHLVARSLYGVAASVKIVDLFAINNREVEK